MRLPEREHVIELVGKMPAELVKQVLDFTLFLQQRHGSNKPIDYSDVWSEEDVRDWMQDGNEELDAIPAAIESLTEFCRSAT